MSAAEIVLTTRAAKCTGTIKLFTGATIPCGSFAAYHDTRNNTFYCANCGKALKP